MFGPGASCGPEIQLQAHFFGLALGNGELEACVESAQLFVCALGEPSYTVELSHVLPAVPLSRVVGHPSSLSC